MNISLAGKGICELDFTRHDPNTADPHELVALRSITSIDASNNQIKAVKRLDIFTSLQSLNLARNQLSSVGALTTELGGGVTRLDVSHNRIESIEEQHTCRWGYRHTEGRDAASRLDAAAAAPGPPSSCTILHGFISLRNLTWLNLGFNEIETPRADAPGQLFPESLCYLDISFNRISSLSCIVFGLCNLRELHCEGNDISDLHDGGVDAIALHCRSMQQLFLDANPVVSSMGPNLFHAVSSMLIPHCREFARLNGEDCCPSPARPSSAQRLTPGRREAAATTAVGDHGGKFDLTREIVSQIAQRTPSEEGAGASEPPSGSRLQQLYPGAAGEAEQHHHRPFLDSSSRPLHAAVEGDDGNDDAAHALARAIPPARTIVVPDEEFLERSAVERGRHAPPPRPRLHADRIEYLRAHSAELTTLLEEAQDSVQHLLSENAQCERELREQRRHVARQLKESAALKAERESLQGVIATLRLGMNKTAAELQHARRVEQRTIDGAKSSQRNRSVPPPHSRPFYPPGSSPFRRSAANVAAVDPPRMTRSHMKLVEATQRRLAAQREADMGIAPEAFRYTSPGGKDDDPLLGNPTPDEGLSFEMGTYFALRNEEVGGDSSFMSRHSNRTAATSTPSPNRRRQQQQHHSNSPRRLADPGPYLRERKWYEQHGAAHRSQPQEPHSRDGSMVGGGMRLSSSCDDTTVSTSMPQLK